MTLPPVAELLTTWERGAQQPWARRALGLLHAFHPGADIDELARLSIGERDARLLSARAALFGSRVDCLASCPRCGERLEASFTIDDIRTPAPPPPAAGQPHHVDVDGYEVTFRLPDSNDILALQSSGDSGSPEGQLLASCLLEARQDAHVIAGDAIPGEVLAVVAQQLAHADPQADVQLALECAACSHRWHSTFDIVAHLWAEVDAWAKRRLEEVHSLASAYGWHERDILAMSPTRRGVYLDLVGA